MPQWDRWVKGWIQASSLVITGGAAVPFHLLVYTGKKSNVEKWANRHFQHQPEKKNGFFISNQKKKSPLPSRLLASYPTRLWTPGCTSRFSTESFWRKKINFLAGSNTVGLFGCVWILSKRSWATVQKKKKAVSLLLSFILKHFFHPVSYDKHFDCYSGWSM